jgi:autonomous glycyl radical cofactor GrcA
MSSEIENINSNVDKTDESLNQNINNENERENSGHNGEDSDEDIFKVLYGDDQNDDIDEDIDDDNYYEEESIEDNALKSSHNIEERKLNLNVLPTVGVENESQQNLSINSNKRQSSEDMTSQAKRVKSEPMSPNRNNSYDNSEEMTTRQLTTTLEMVECDEEIPKTSHEFMLQLLDWDPNDLESNSQIPMANKLKDITNVLRFNDLDTLCHTFIPPIIINMWEKVKHEYNLKRSNSKLKASETRLLSILTKKKSKKMKNGLEMKCISLRKVNESPVFGFGQLVTIRTAVQLKPNSNAPMITRKSHFGYVVSHVIRESNQQNQSEVNHMRHLNEDKRDSVLIEEVIFLTKFSDELYLRNDTLIVAEPILCIHNYHLQSRAIYKFEQFPLSRQFFNPVFRSKASGLLNTANKDKFDILRLECIQVALDVVANTSSSNSCILAINGSSNCGKTILLLEIVKQICNQFPERKILFTASNDQCLSHVNDLFNKSRVLTFLLGKDFNPTIAKLTIKYIKHKLAKDVVINDIKKKKLFEECLEYFESDMNIELSAESCLFKNTILEQVKHDSMSRSNVIIGRIDDMCNDIAFYKYFANRDAFSCCIVDDSETISEPKLYSLLWFGVTKLIIAGNYENRNNSDESDVCKRLGLSRSFFERYCSLCPQDLNNTTLTVFNL